MNLSSFEKIDRLNGMRMRLERAIIIRDKKFPVPYVFMCAIYERMYGGILFDDIPEILKYMPIGKSRFNTWFSVLDIESRLKVIHNTIKYIYNDTK